MDLEKEDNPTNAEIEKLDRIRKEAEKKNYEKIINDSSKINSQTTCFGDELKVILNDISNKCTNIDDRLDDIESELIEIKELIINNSTKS